jgi:transcription termination factor Rho
VRLDTINGGDSEAGPQPVEFGKLTPLYPQDRLRLETEPNILTTRSSTWSPRSGRASAV